jgi:RNA ligase (TIGR02306 family)
VKSQRHGSHLSQGLIFPLADFPEISLPYDDRVRTAGNEAATAGLLAESFADLLGVVKWEFTENAASLPSLGKPPSFIYLPGWERIQNIERSIFSNSGRKKVWQISEKLDGVTMMVYKLTNDSEWTSCLPALPAGCSPSMQDEKNRYGVCSRREDLIDRDGNLYWQVAKKSGVLDRLCSFGLANFAVQGELCGSSIEGNTMNYPEGEHEFIVFGIWNIDTNTYMPPKDLAALCDRLGIKHTPILGYSSMQGYARNLYELLRKAEEGTSGFGGVREGFVFKSLDGTEQFKVISNKWLSLTGK